MRRVVWETDAADQFTSVLTYIADRNIVAAESLARVVSAQLEHTRSLPEIGRPGRVIGTRELVIHPNYILVYQITESEIDVIRFLHARQQYP